MNTFPLFLQLISESKLLMAVLSTCSLTPIYESQHHIVYSTESSVYIEHFRLGNLEFESAIFSIDEAGYARITLMSGGSELLYEVEKYFGNKTVYTPIQHILDRDGVKPPRPFQYLFREFTVPIFVSMLPSKCGSKDYQCSVSIDSNHETVFAKTFAEKFLNGDFDLKQ